MQETNRAANARKLVPIVAVVAAVLALMPELRGAIVLTEHEGDTLHLSDMVLRMAEYGQIPHRDFMTPLGILGLWPIALFKMAGLGIGHAMMAAQAAVAAVLFMPVMRVALSRFPGWLAWVHALYVMAICLAIVYGGTDSTLGMSMHYNRWAWALAYIAVPLALLEPLAGRSPRTSVLDGALIGLALAGMLLIKVTYFVAFLPAVLIALLLRRDGRALLAALVSGLVVTAGVSAVLGWDFWLLYAQDVLRVAGSETRAAPGDSFDQVLAAPKYLAGSLAVLAAIVLLRRGGQKPAGLFLLLLLPGFLYVTYQNFGNDPQWLILFGLIVFALVPAARAVPETQKKLVVVGIVALTLGASAAATLLLSPFRLMNVRDHDLTPILSQRPEDQDILAKSSRMFRVKYGASLDGPGMPFESYATRPPLPEKEPKPAVLNGETLADCELSIGLAAWNEATAQDLQKAGYGGSSLLVTDLLSPFWLYGDLKPLEGGAPWYYSGAPGLSHADYVLVPLCPGTLDRRRIMLDAIAAAGWTLTEERRTSTYILLRPSKG